jgi:hypothetical protein
MLEKVGEVDRADLVDELTRWHIRSVDEAGLHWRPTVRIVSARPRD